MFNIPSGWSVDDNASSIVNSTPTANGILTVVLTGPILGDATTSLGEIRFSPTLSKSGKTTAITLASSDFLTASGTKVGNCLAVSDKGTQFQLVYSCGDSTLVNYLNNGNAPSMIKPINPNPVSSSNGGIVSFQYVTKHEGNVTIIVYDELGKEVARVVDHQFHPAGTYEVRYDASKLISGSYIYRFQLDNHRALSGRMVVGN